MANKKLPMYQPPKDLNSIEDVFLRDMAFRSKISTPYCKHCGQVILESPQDKEGFAVNYEWEIKNKAHFKCHKKHQADVETKLSIARAEEEKRKAEEAANFDWDKYMEDMMKDK